MTVAPAVISASAAPRGQGQADLMFSWKGVQGLLDESAELDANDDDDDDGDSEGEEDGVPAVYTGAQRHAGDISFTSSDLYPDDGHAQPSLYRGPSYVSTGPTTPASSRSVRHPTPSVRSGAQQRGETSGQTDPRRRRHVSRQSLLAVFNSPVSERHQYNQHSPPTWKDATVESRSPSLALDDASSAPGPSVSRHRRADTDMTIRPARPTNSPSYPRTSIYERSRLGSDSRLHSESESQSEEESEPEQGKVTSTPSPYHAQILSSSPTQLEPPPLLPITQPSPPISSHKSQNPVRPPRHFPPPRTLQHHTRPPASRAARKPLLGRRIQSQTVPQPTRGERTPLLPHEGEQKNGKKVYVPPPLLRARTAEGVVSNEEGKRVTEVQASVSWMHAIDTWVESKYIHPALETVNADSPFASGRHHPPVTCDPPNPKMLDSLPARLPIHLCPATLRPALHDTRNRRAWPGLAPAGIFRAYGCHGDGLREFASHERGYLVLEFRFHPGRSIGSMFLASKYCIVLALLAALFSLASIFTLQLFDHFFPKEGTWGFQVGDVTVLVLWIGSSMAGLAWLKQWVNNPSFNTASISNLVCFTLWPQSATTKLQTSIATTLDSFSTLFRLLNATFLLDRPPNDASYTSLQTAAQSHSAAFTQLKADLAEAQHERLLDRRINAKQRERYAAVTDSLTRLAQHLTGMRGGTGLQSDLLRGTKQGILQVKTASSFDSDASDESEETRSRGARDKQESLGHGKQKIRGDRDLSKAGNLFWAFRDEVAEEMRQLTDLSCKVLHDVKLAMTDLNSSADHSTLLRADHALLQAALKSFTTTTIYAINTLYHGTLHKHDSAIFGAPRTSESGSSEAVYLIYFFIFTLEEFVREEIQLVEAMCELVAGSHRTSLPGFTRWFSPARWRRQIHATGKRSRLRRGILQLNPLDPSDLQPPVFPKKDKNNPNTLTTPSPENLSKRERVYQALWALQARLRENDIKYALKVGLGTVILASPAFSTRYRDTFLEFRGEWALIAFWATMSPSIGSTNLWVDLALSNLTCLYAYNQRQSDLSAFEIGWRRATSVIVGVMWATVVSNYWWPFAARKELRIGLSDFCLDLAYLYSRLVRVYSQSHDEACTWHPLVDQIHDSDDQVDSLTLMSKKELENDMAIRQFMSMELHLQIQLIKLRALLTQTANEPRLKGPFPKDTYGNDTGQIPLYALRDDEAGMGQREWSQDPHPGISELK
ncbi:hypothetical protein QFC19_008965 [Naganishia cerealis]|uniref:Uncharacterized protein n=1 Tax=Naganishia cerealis TaxID=610337 RepID=A0ACC2UYK8_9TREE|nr:hypothetical protein QFC19_008965 [Naganishia cerealis]